MDWDTFRQAKIRIEYANTAKMNRIRAWAKKNGCTVNVSRYAKDAYEGHLIVPMPQGRDGQLALILDFKTSFLGYVAD